MKKVLALVLAVMMMATVAFATTTPNTSADDVVDKENTILFGGYMAPGDTLYVYRGMDSGDEVNGNPVTPTNTFNAQITSENYTITNQKWTEGKSLLSGLVFDDKNNQLKINLVEDYTLKQSKRLAGSFTLKGKGKGGDRVGGKATKPNNIKVEINITVGNWKQDVIVDPDNDVTLGWNNENAAALAGNNGRLFVTPTTAAGSGAYVNAYGIDNVMNNAVQKFVTGNYGTVVLNCADQGDTEVTFRAYKNDEFFLWNNTTADNALLKAYADKDAEISFLNFPSGQTLNSTATIRFYKDETSHVYVMKDGKLTSEVKWDDDEDCFILKTRTLGNYVFSDKALPFNVETTANPDTGANDVVGIATALAAVALVSAAAVSLKK